MEEEFKLPENWAVEVTEENKDILNKWRYSKIGTNDGPLPSEYSYMSYTGYGCKKDDEGKIGGRRTKIEISFKQFKIHILKESPLPEKWCLALTKENINVINEWRESINPNHNFLRYNAYAYIYEDSWGYQDKVQSGKIDDYKPVREERPEITTKDFVEFVFNKKGEEKNLIKLLTAAIK